MYFLLLQKKRLCFFEKQSLFEKSNFQFLD